MRTATSSSEFTGRPSDLHLKLTYVARLVNPYVQPVLYIRRPGSDLEESHRFPDDDPFFSEVRLLLT